MRTGISYQKHLNVNLNVCWLTFSTALEALCATSRSSTSWRRPSPSSHSPSRPQPSPIPWVRASTSRGGSSSRDLSLPLDHSRLQVRPSQKLQFTFFDTYYPLSPPTYLLMRICFLKALLTTATRRVAATNALTTTTLRTTFAPALATWSLVRTATPANQDRTVSNLHLTMPQVSAVFNFHPVWVSLILWRTF